jgi:hypothetical protein
MTSAQRTTDNGTNPWQRTAYAGLLAAGLVAVATPAAAQITPTTIDAIEWDLPAFGGGAGTCPAAIGALTRRPPNGEPVDPLFYVTRCEDPDPVDPDNPARLGPKLVQFMPGNEVTPGGSMAEDPGRWTAWHLGPIPGSPVGGGDFSPTGGMRLTTRFMAFVRGATQLIRLNLSTNQLTRWNDVFISPEETLVPSDPNAVSDVAIVERSYGAIVDVWTTQDGFVRANGSLVPVVPGMPPGFVQRLTVSNTSNTATVTRWAVDGGAGRTYLSGVAYFNGKIYYAESAPVTIDPLFKRGNSLAILDPVTNKVVRFSLAEAGLGPLVSGPLQITIDTTGTAWVLTQSGHLVSHRLRPDGKADMAAYVIPGNGEGVPNPTPMTAPISLSASGGHIGFTESAENAVGLLIPNKSPLVVSPGVAETATYVTTTLTGTPDSTIPQTDLTNPEQTNDSPAFHTDIDPLGEFIEGRLPVNMAGAGAFPIGILRDWNSDTFWVTQLGGPNGHRLSRVVFPPDTVLTGMVTGGGTLDPSGTTLATADPNPDAWASDGGKSNFGFNVYRKTSTGTLRGNLTYLNKVTGEKVKSIIVRTFTVTGNTARFTGDCTNNGLPCTFDVTVQDNGNPGKGRDHFSISGLGIVSNSGTLNGGNILVHKK